MMQDLSQLRPWRNVTTYRFIDIHEVFGPRPSFKLKFNAVASSKPDLRTTKEKAFSDEELMQAYQDTTSEAAFREIFERYAERLHMFFSRGIKDKDNVDDLVQQTLLSVHKSRLRYDKAQSFKAWIFGIAFHVRYDHLRLTYRDINITFYGDPESEHASIATNADPEMWLRASQWQEHLVNAITHLPEGLRHIFQMHKLEGIALIDIAKNLNMNESTVRVYALRANGLVRKHMEDHGLV